MKRKEVKNSIISIIFITLLSQIIALVREAIFAYYYGINSDVDAYVLASQIPITLFAIISTAINTILLPLYLQKRRTTNAEKADTFVKSLIISLTCVSTIVVAIEEIFAMPIVKLFAPGFSDSVLQRTAYYSRILFPSVIMTGIINIFTAILNAEGRFLYPTLAALSQNIVLIIVMSLFSKHIGLLAAVWGTIAGIACNLVLIIIKKTQIFFVKADLKAFKADIMIVLYRVLPITVGVGVDEINKVIDRAIASQLDGGSITALNYSNKLTTVLAALVLSAVSTVAYKEFSQFFVEKEYRQRVDSLNAYLSLLCIFLVPITCGAVLLKREIIIIAFARGAFEIEEIARTADIFMFYALGIIFIAVRDILSRYFLSTGNTKTPLLNSVVGVMLNIMLNILLSRVMGASGLALSTTISGGVVCVLLFMSAYKRENEFSIERFVKNFIVVTFSTFIMVSVINVFNQNITIVNAYIKFLSNIIIGILIYFGSLSVISRNLVLDSLKMLFKNKG